MKTLFIAGMAGWLISATPLMSSGQGTTLGSRMPSVPSEQTVRYQYVYIKSEPGATTYSGHVDFALNPTTLYYREYRNNQQYREVLYNRSTHQVLLLNHLQNRLDVFSELPYNSVPFIPFPFQDEAIARVVVLAPARNMPLSEKTTKVSLPGTLSKSMQSVPVKFQATLTPSASGSKVKTFSIHAPDGEVARWAFTYGNSSKTALLPTTITRQLGSPIMTEEDRARYQRRETVLSTHWRPESRVIYTLAQDRLAEADAIPTAESFLGRMNDKTPVIDRRDMNNVARFQYRKEGGNMEEQIAAARSQSGSFTGDAHTLGRWLGAGGTLLVAPFVLSALCLIGGVWIALRRKSPSTDTHSS